MQENSVHYTFKGRDQLQLCMYEFVSHESDPDLKYKFASHQCGSCIFEAMRLGKMTSKEM